MTKFKKFFQVFAIMMVLTIVSPSCLPAGSLVVAQAATIKLNKKEITLEVGKSQTLKVTGTKKKVTWSSSKKSVATVSSTGKVTAKKAGTAVITAKVDNKKYTCKVTVIKANDVNPYLAKAPFKAFEAKEKNISFILPYDWKTETVETDISSYLMAYPKENAEKSATSGVTIMINQTGGLKYDVNLIKSILTEEYMKEAMAQSGVTEELKDFKQSEYKANLGTALKTEYTITMEGIVMKQVIYDLAVDNYVFEVTVTDIGDGVTPDVYTVGEFLLNSITLEK